MAHGTMIKRLVCATSGTHVARCVKWSRFGRGSMAKVGQDSGKEQKGRTRRGGRSDEMRFAGNEGVSGRIQARELRGGITGVGERSRTGSATAAIFHGADVRFRSTIITKYKQKWRTRGKDEGGTSRGGGGREVREIRSERGKWERRKSSAERQRGSRGGKRTDRLDDTTVVPVVHWVSLFPFFPPFFRRSLSHSHCSVRVLHV